MKQVRGKDLEDRIESVIRELALNAKKRGEKYVYNASELARAIPTTRKTLRRYDVLVERVVDDLKSRRRMSTGVVGLEQLRDEVARLKEKIEEKDKVILALRSHHVEMYRRLHEHSLDGALLVRPILELESVEAGLCLLCGSSKISEVHSHRHSNVTELRANRRRKS